MKPIGSSYEFNASNAWGRDVRTVRREYEIEVDDVGVTRDNYLGYRHASYRFTHMDLHRKIVVAWDERGWQCWWFV